MSLFLPARSGGPWRAVLLSFLASARADVAAADPPLDAARYVETVLRAHPAARQIEALGAAADAERKAARPFPDPVLEYARGQAEPTGAPGIRGTETGWTISQTIPWPGTLSAGREAGDRAADAVRASADALRYALAARAREAFARLLASRTLRDVARAAEEDARSLRDLVTRRAELGESRESDRIKAVVEWLRQQRALAAAEREAVAAEAIVRSLAVEPLPTPLEVRRDEYPPLPSLDREALRRLLLEHHPARRVARAEADRKLALSSVARRERIPDLDLGFFWLKELDKKTRGFTLGVKVPALERQPRRHRPGGGGEPALGRGGRPARPGAAGRRWRPASRPSKWPRRRPSCSTARSFPPRPGAWASYD